MKIGVMQPYFFPYIGYWQLMNLVDVYVIFDDVNYINRGWINRNRILFNGEPRYINLPVKGASQNKKINEIEVNHDRKLFDNCLALIKEAYRKAPYFSEVYPMLREILCCKEKMVSDFIADTFRFICAYLAIDTKRVLSSEITEKNNDLKGQDKIIDICRVLGGDHYINAIGGMELYDSDAFAGNGMKLGFLRTGRTEYRQFDNVFSENLSIIDVMMFNSREQVIDMLNNYTIVTGTDRA